MNNPLIIAQPVDGVAAGAPLSGSVMADAPFKMVRLFSGAGAPSASTLYAKSNPGTILTLGTNGAYLVNDLYLDTTANAMYRCSTAGTNTTSVWAQISGGGGGGGAVWL